MQAGVDKWEAAGFLGMTVDLLDRVYGHHHPLHLQRAARAIGYRPRNESLGETLAETGDLAHHHVKLLKTLVGPAGLEPATRPL
ncbi:hypothetical protein [Afipia massiliensis]|uniref:hypothetical protein n=1 Tax=Afipia massiliensis TaxID=211460 RepID=UPI001FE2C7E9|nr:hypothetical protein [Afipia massiliensis]